jgi:hypothetical protein
MRKSYSAFSGSCFVFVVIPAKAGYLRKMKVCAIVSVGLVHLGFFYEAEFFFDLFVSLPDFV